MKFKDIEDNTFILNIHNSERIGGVKRKVSERIVGSNANIILMYQNVILDEEKCIGYYNIRPEHFVLFYVNRYSSTQLADDLSHHPIIHMICGLTISRKSQQENDKEYWSSLECVNGDYEIRKFFLHNREQIIEDVLTFLSDEIGIPSSNIKLFKDLGLINPINNRKDINTLKNIKKSQTIKIYYKIIPDIADLVKLELLGCGAFGSVYKCLELGSKDIVALKKFNISRKEFRQYERLHSEIDFLRVLGSHPRIVQFEGTIYCDDGLYLVMEYMPGGSLGQYCRNHGSLPEDQISKFSRQILEAVEYLHSKKILHRDIKGDNVLLDRDWSVKLCDFGLAKSLLNIASEDLLNGVVQSSVGTANWIAPEVIHGEKYGISADIWSFGATVVEMLTGRPPFTDMNMYQVIFKIGQERKIEFQEPENMSNAMRRFIDLCTQPNPSYRPTSSQLLKHDFITSFTLIN